MNNHQHVIKQQQQQPVFNIDSISRPVAWKLILGGCAAFWVVLIALACQIF
ncbi:hypothetical protein [Nissabacter sp. SGAir0207]|uniref:hypothetical protein n=1 Tax=Nissabacter sp. SGAir0207 TaxID=2126321 RepID=UPI00143DC377|nr:hypothetical protein [Nissabacter sp. SGAir0207]